MTQTISQYLRTRVPSVLDDYERAVAADLPVLLPLGRSAILDHLPEFVLALADWVEAHLAAAAPARPFALLAEGHALQRLGFAVPLETLTVEYTLLRQVILRNLAPRPPTIDELIAFDLGIDQAVLEAMRRYAGQRELVRERFIGILGHDLRGPLSVIAMGAQTLLSLDGVSELAARSAARIDRNVGRMTAMIDDVLDFARGQLGTGIPATPTRQDLGVLCRDALGERAARAPDRVLRLEVRGDLRGTWDGPRVCQALGNLIGNAIAHGADPIVVRAWESDDRGTVFASVTNAGPAIPGDLMPALFDPFRRGKSPGGSGVGLGLYIVQQIALAHGGACAFTSAEGETVATLTFPRVPVDELPDRP